MITGGVSPQSRAFLLIVSSLQTSSLCFDLLSSLESHIMLLGDSSPPPPPIPPLFYSLSLSGSLTIVRSRSNPNLQGSLTGAPFNCLVQAAASWRQNDSTQVFCFPLYFLFALSFPLHACSYSCYSVQPAPSPVTQGLFIPACLMWYKLTHSTSKKKKTKKWTWRFLGYFSTLIQNDRIMFSKCGRRAGVASTFTASKIDRFAKRSCAPTTHTNYLKTTHTLPTQSRQTGFLLALTEKKNK